MAEGSNNAPGFEEAPKPQELERAPAGQVVESQPATIETVGRAQESSTGKQAPQLFPAAQPPAPVQDQPVAAQPAAPVADDDSPVKDLVAKDGDLIEKQWIASAKSIIAKTANDPRKQKHEVSKIKAAYIQKRF